MPVGLIIMFWDERMGAKVVKKYPEEISMDFKTLMQIYSLMLGALNIASYYTGPESNYYIILLLNIEEDADMYESALADATRYILQRIKYAENEINLQYLFHQISEYPSLNSEQLLALTYHEEIKRIIINRLKDEGVVSKSDLLVWLKDKYAYGFIDLDAVLIDLVKKNIIKQASVKGIVTENIFLKKLIYIIRSPPVKILNDPVGAGLPKKLNSVYKAEVMKFFKVYHPTEEDNINLAKIMIDHDCYEVLKLLRTSIVTMNDLEKLKKKGVTDINATLKDLWNSKIIQVFENEEKLEYMVLLSDIEILEIFPEYILEIIKNNYQQKSMANQLLLEYLSILQDTYYDLHEKSE